MGPLVFCTIGPWGGGKGALLEETEVDHNFWSLATAIYDLAAAPNEAVGIASITVSGTQMTITLTDGSVLGPFTLPTLVFRWRGPWTPGTSYAQIDVVTIEGTDETAGVWMCQLAHTSGSSFNQADGNWYQLFGAYQAIDPHWTDYLSIGDGADPAGGLLYGDLSAQRLFANHATGFLGVNRNAANAPAGIPGSDMLAQFNGTDGNQPDVIVDAHGSPGTFRVRRANGTGGAPSATQANDFIGNLAFNGYGATAYTGQPSVRLRALALENFSDTAYGGALRIDTTPIGGAITQQVQIGPGLTVGNPTPPAGGALIGDVNALRVLVNGVVVGSGGGALPDAASDSYFYGRYNAAWARVLGLTGGTITGTSPGTINIQRGGNPPGIPGAPALVSLMRLTGADAENSSVEIEAAAGIPQLSLWRFDGSLASPSAVLSGENIGQVSFRGYGATTYPAGYAGRIACTALQNFTDTQQGSEIIILASPVGTTAPVVVARFGPGLTVGAPTVPPGGNLAGDVNALRVLVNGSPVSAGGGLSDAPSDNFPYGRLNAAWQRVIGAAGGSITGSLSLGGAQPAHAADGGLLAGDLVALRVLVNANAAVPTGARATYNLRLVGADGIPLRAMIDSFGASNVLQLRRANGTAAAPTPTVIDNQLGQVAFGGSDTAGTLAASNAVNISAVAAENWSATAHGAALSFYTTAIGSTANLERMRIEASGNVTLGAQVPTSTMGPGTLLLNPGSNPPSTFPTVAGLNLAIFGADAQANNPVIFAFAGNANINLARAQGTAAAPSHPVAGTMGRLAMGGWSLGGWQYTKATVQFAATENWTDGANGTRIEFTTTNTGGTASSTKVQIGPGLIVGAPTPPAGGDLVGDVNAQRILVNGAVIAGGGSGGLPLTGGTLTGNLIINRNTAALPPALGGATALWINFADAEQSNVVLDSYFSNFNFVMRRANGTGAAPSAILATEALGAIHWRGHQGAAYTSNVASIRINALENFTSGAQGTRVAIATIPVGTTTLADQAVFGPGLTVGPAVAPTGGLQTGDLAALRLFVNNNAAALPAPAGAPVATLAGADGTFTGLEMLAWGSAGAGVSPRISFRRARGIGSAPTAVQSGDNLGALQAIPYGATSWAAAARAQVQFQATENWSDTAQGAAIAFTTTAAGGTTLTTQAKIAAGLLIGTPGDPEGVGSLVINSHPTIAAPSPTGNVILHLAGGDGVGGAALFDAFGIQAQLTLRRANGTAGAPSATLNLDNIGVLQARGRGATSYSAGRATLWMYATENWTDTAQGTAVQITTTANGGTATRIDATFGPGATIGAPTAPAGGMQSGDLNAQRLIQNGTPLGYSWGLSAPVGVLTNGQVIGHHVVSRPCTLAANFAGCFAGGTANATGSTAFAVAKATTGTGTYTAIGTITFAAGGISWTGSCSATALAVGDIVRVTGPATADATFSSPFFTFVAS